MPASTSRYIGVPCETSTPNTSVPVSACVSKWIRPTGAMAACARPDVRLRDRVVAAEDDRDRAGSDDAGRLSASIAACVLCGICRQDGRVAEVDHAENPGRIDLRLEVRPPGTACGADRPRPEARAGTVGDEVVRRRADDGDVDAVELAPDPRVYGSVPNVSSPA